MLKFKDFLAEAELPDDYIAKVVGWIIDEPTDMSKLTVQRSGKFISVYYNGDFNEEVVKQQLTKAGLTMKSDGNGDYFEKSKAVIEFNGRLSISDLAKFASTFAKAVGKPPKELSDADIVKMIVSVAEKLKPYKRKVIGTASKMESIMMYATKIYEDKAAREKFIKELEKQSGVTEVSFQEFNEEYTVKTEDGSYSVIVSQVESYGGYVITVKG